MTFCRTFNSSRVMEYIMFQDHTPCMQCENFNAIIICRVGLGERKVPPRLYCDICEEFDLHETEDCPQQANDDIPAAHLHKRDVPEFKKPAERPYCETCEGNAFVRFKIKQFL